MALMGETKMAAARTSQPVLAQFGAPSTMGLLLSGGLDSAILLFQLLAHDWQVRPFYIRTGCVWQGEELQAVRRLLAALRQPGLLPLVELDLPLEDLYAGHWSMTGQAVPDGTTSDEAVFLPGRNPLLLVKPAVWCAMHGISQLALATLAANPFGDATPERAAKPESGPDREAAR